MDKYLHNMNIQNLRYFLFQLFLQSFQMVNGQYLEKQGLFFFQRLVLVKDFCLFILEQVLNFALQVLNMKLL